MEIQKENYNYNEILVKQIISEDDKATRECILEYVKNNYKEKNIRVDFISKEKVDLIIDLGVKALLKSENKKNNNGLKIIDDIELSELEDFDFEEGRDTYDFCDGVRRIIVYKKDRIIRLNNFNRKSQLKLYDLIKANLVEKF